MISLVRRADAESPGRTRQNSDERIFSTTCKHTSSAGFLHLSCRSSSLLEVITNAQTATFPIQADNASAAQAPQLLSLPQNFLSSRCLIHARDLLNWRDILIFGRGQTTSPVTKSKGHVWSVLLCVQAINGAHLFKALVLTGKEVVGAVNVHVRPRTAQCKSRRVPQHLGSHTTSGRPSALQDDASLSASGGPAARSGFHHATHQFVADKEKWQ